MGHALTVFICGASVAGCSAAILLRQAGHRVVLVEKKPDALGYKKLCTHFIQPSGIPVLQRMGLMERVVQAGGTRTKAALLTPAGWIDRPGPYQVLGGGEGAYAMNIEREVLDPILRERAAQVGAEVFYGTRCVEMSREGVRWRIATDHPDLRDVLADVLVAADGRASAIAQTLGNPAITHENQRATYFSYVDVRDVAFDRTRSIFANHGREMAFLYPLAGDRALLSIYITKERASSWSRGENVDAQMVSFCAEIAGFPSMAGCRRLSPVYGYVDYPSIVRSPVWAGCAFVGDAALSLDPMSGVGCAFAMQSAAMLADGMERAEGHAEAGLQAYQELHRAFFPPHVTGIVADSLASRSTESLKVVYQTVLTSDRLQDDYLALTGRLLEPKRFQQAFIRQAAALN